MGLSERPFTENGRLPERPLTEKQGILELKITKKRKLSFKTRVISICPDRKRGTKHYNFFKRGLSERPVSKK